MNFLAHAYLSGGNPKVLVGNFIADFVKGKQALKLFDADITKGIELHRLIDSFTDDHAVVRESKNRLRAKYRHYAAVIVDVYYDHFLAKNWSQYHNQPLFDFANHVYKTVESFYPVAPEGIKFMLPHMIRGNWLVNYAKVEGIERALTGMASRTPYDSRMNEAGDDLRAHYELFEQEFMTFFPELTSVCREWRITHTAG